LAWASTATLTFAEAGRSLVTDGQTTVDVGGDLALDLGLHRGNEVGQLHLGSALDVEQRRSSSTWP